MAYANPDSERRWRVKNREHLVEYQRRWRAEHPERAAKHRRQWHEKNRERVAEYKRQWVKENRKTVSERQRQWLANRLDSDPVFRLVFSMRTRVRNAVRGVKSAKTIALIGCSEAHLRAHIEKQFRPGMSWENYGPVWHVDHIRPCASFNLSDPEQQRVCFHFTNLQPLFAKENLSKGDKMPENLKPVEPTQVHPNPPPSSPFHYGPESEEERNRELAMDRQTDKIPNNPSRPVL